MLEPVSSRDEMGGLETTYESRGFVYSKVNDQTSSYRQINEDTITATTKFFIVRDISTKYPINASWRISWDNYIYVIESVQKLMDSLPYYIEIQATRLGG